ncbi:hypothetical protein FKM82_028878 [Ascaphus truei]
MSFPQCLGPTKVYGVTLPLMTVGALRCGTCPGTPVPRYCRITNGDPLIQRRHRPPLRGVNSRWRVSPLKVTIMGGLVADHRPQVTACVCH